MPVILRKTIDDIKNGFRLQKVLILREFIHVEKFRKHFITIDTGASIHQNSKLNHLCPVLCKGQPNEQMWH